jgi:hypothetical protein
MTLQEDSINQIHDQVSKNRSELKILYRDLAKLDTSAKNQDKRRAALESDKVMRAEILRLQEEIEQLYCRIEQDI